MKIRKIRKRHTDDVNERLVERGLYHYNINRLPLKAQLDFHENNGNCWESVIVQDRNSEKVKGYILVGKRQINEVVSDNINQNLFKHLIGYEIVGIGFSDIRVLAILIKRFQRDLSISIHKPNYLWLTIENDNIDNFLFKLGFSRLDNNPKIYYKMIQ